MRTDAETINCIFLTRRQQSNNLHSRRWSWCRERHESSRVHIQPSSAPFKRK